MKKILTKINLIFILVVLLLSVATPVFAATGTNVSITRLINERVSDFYVLLRAVALASMVILLIILGIRAATKSSAEAIALLKRMIPDWLIGMALIFFIHYFMIAVITLNEMAVAGAENMGQSLSGMEEGQENVLYEEALTKAYEIEATSGTIGMFLYITLVGYTCKFLMVYLKRYVNVITLILIAPIICFVYAFRKVTSGRGVLLKQWVKEFLYNVLLQSLHATIYATFIGLTLKFSDDYETFIGAILTLIIFGFAFKLDKLVRKLFNMVGGSTSLPRTLGQELVSDTKKVIVSGAVSGDPMSALSSMGNKYSARMDAKLNEVKQSFRLENIDRDIKEIGKSINGEYKEVSKEQIAKEQEKIDNAGVLGKTFNKIQGVIVNLPDNTKKKYEELKNYLIKKKNEATTYVNDLKSDVRAIKSIPTVVRRAKMLPEKMKQLRLPQNRRINPASLPIYVDNYDAVIDPEIDVDAMMGRIKLLVDMSVKEVASAIVVAESYQGLMAEPRLGFAILAEENYKAMMHEQIDEKNRRTIKLASRQAKRVFTFGYFGNSSIRTITESVTDSFMHSNSYTRTLGKVIKSVKAGEIKFKEVDGPLETIKYTAKAKTSSRLQSRAQIAISSLHSFRSDAAWAISVNLLNQYEETSSKMTMDSFTVEELKALEASGKIVRVNGATLEESGYIIADEEPMDSMAGQLVNDFLIKNPEDPLARKINDLLAQDPENEEIIKLSSYVIENPESPMAQVFDFVTINEEGKPVLQVNNEVLQGNVATYELLIEQITQGDLAQKAEFEDVINRVIAGENTVALNEIEVPLTDMLTSVEVTENVMENVQVFIQTNPESEMALQIKDMLEQHPDNEEVVKLCSYIIENEDENLAQRLENIVVKEDGTLVLQVPNNELQESMPLLEQIVQGNEEKLAALTQVLNSANVETVVPQVAEVKVPLMFTLDNIEPSANMEQTVQEFIEANPENETALQMRTLLDENPENKDVLKLCNYVIENPEEPLAQAFSQVTFDEEGQLILQISGEELKQAMPVIEQVNEDFKNRPTTVEERMQEVVELLTPEVLAEPAKIAEIQDVEMRIPVLPATFTSEEVVEMSEMVENIGVFINTSDDTKTVSKISELLTENSESTEIVQLCDFVIRNPESELAKAIECVTVDETGQIILNVGADEVKQRTEVIAEVLEEYNSYKKVQEDLQQISDLISSEIPGEIQIAPTMAVAEDIVVNTIPLDGLLSQISEVEATDRLEQMLAEVVVGTPASEVEYELVYAESKKTEALKTLTGQMEPETLSFDEKSGTIYSNTTMSEETSEPSTFDEIMELMKQGDNTTISSTNDIVPYFDETSVDSITSASTEISKEDAFDSLMERLISASSENATLAENPADSTTLAPIQENEPINVEIIGPDLVVPEEPAQDFNSLMEMIMGNKTKETTASSSEKVLIPSASSKPKANRLRITSNEQKQEKDTERLLAFYVYGEVKKPGRYMVKYGSKVYEVINKFAGGFTREADKNSVADKLSLPVDENITGISIPKKPVEEKDKKEKDDISKDTEKVVPKNAIVCYITGAVRVPGEKIMRKGSKVVDLIERAGGYTDEVNLSQLPLLEAELTDGEVVFIPKRTVEDEYAARGISLEKVEKIILDEYQKYKERIGITLSDIEKGKKHREIVLTKIKEVLQRRENIKLSKEELEERIDDFIKKQRELLRKTKGKGKFISDASMVEHKSQIDLVKNMLANQFGNDNKVVMTTVPASEQKQEKRAQIIEQLREMMNLGV